MPEYEITMKTADGTRRIKVTAKDDQDAAERAVAIGMGEKGVKPSDIKVKRTNG